MKGDVLQDTVIQSLTRETCEAHAALLLSFSRDQLWEDWTAENLLAPRILKWDLSIIAVSAGVPIGYAIVSAKADRIHHLHRFAVHALWRRSGIGSLMIARIIDRSSACGGTTELKVHRDNHPAIAFYRRHGFSYYEIVESQYAEMRLSLDVRRLKT